MSIEKDIEKAKKSLTNKAKRNGLSENFGDKEIRKLEGKYGMYDKQIIEFREWCWNVDLNML